MARVTSDAGLLVCRELAAGAGFSIVGWIDKLEGRVLPLAHTEIMVGKGLIKG